MICRYKLFHFTVTNTCFTALLTHRGKTKFATVKWYNLGLQIIQYAISQIQVVHSVLHLVTYLDVGNFWDKSTETTLRVQVLLRFSYPNKPSQSESLAWLAVIRKSEENLLKMSCKTAPVTKVVHIFWWRHDNRKQSASHFSALENWRDVSCDIPYYKRVIPYVRLSSVGHRNT